MLKKPTRAKQIPNQDKKQPQTISELIRRYDLGNTKVYNYLDYLVEELNKEKKEQMLNTKSLASLIYVGRKVYTLASWVDTPVEQDIELKAIGDAFSISGNGLMVKRDMKVLLSAQIGTFDCPISSQFSIKITGSISGYLGFVNSNTTQGLMSHQIVPIVRDIKAGEIIRAYMNTQVPGNYTLISDNIASYLTVQEL
ncbi:MAG: hypothetical protein HFJ48_00100 [Clostridia bacterium]|nr:hypothetical protein [Clostridia bacterium]